MISLKPELAKDLMWRVLRFAMVGSCELKIYCNWGKFRWQYERLKEVLYKLLFSRGFYFREFREWTSKREFNNARKYSHINLQHYEIILSTNTHGEQMQQHTAHASHTCTTSSTYCIHGENKWVMDLLLWMELYVQTSREQVSWDWVFTNSMVVWCQGISLDECTWTRI